MFDFPTEHRRRMRTTKGLERVKRELARRTKVVSIFPNEAALLRLSSAVLMEIDEQWQTGRVYLTFETQGSPSQSWLWKSGPERSDVHFSTAEQISS